MVHHTSGVLVRLLGPRSFWTHLHCISLFTDDCPDEDCFAVVGDIWLHGDAIIPAENQGRSIADTGVFERTTRDDAPLAARCTADASASACLRDDAAAVNATRSTGTFA